MMKENKSMKYRKTRERGNEIKERVEKEGKIKG